MSWIQQISDNDADGRLAELYEDIGKKRGKVANILRVQSLNPEALKGHLDFYMTLLFGNSPLKRKQREMIAVVVSSINQCSYCINHHAESLKKLSKDEEWTNRLAKNYREATLAADERAMLEYCEEVTRSATSSEERLETLRNHGFSDRAILDMNMITGYFNFVNRMANGLGVGFDDNEVKGYKV